MKLRDALGWVALGWLLLLVDGRLSRDVFDTWRARRRNPYLPPGYAARLRAFLKARRRREK